MVQESTEARPLRVASFLVLKSRGMLLFPVMLLFLIGVAPFCPFSASLLRSPRRLNLLPWRNTFAKSAGLQLVYYKTIQKSTVGTIPKQSQLAP
jgi:hypothetical protein